MKLVLEGKKTRYSLSLATLVLILAAGLIGWWIGHHNSTGTNTGGSAAQTSSVDTVANTPVKSLVSYTLPDGWSETSCAASANVVYIVPNGTSADCIANPSAPVKMYVDSQNTTDCQQLKPVSTQGVRKHTCISLYINGHKSLKSFTDANGTSTADYFVNTGKGVVKVEYAYTSGNEFQSGFDQLATSIKVNN